MSSRSRLSVSIRNSIAGLNLSGEMRLQALKKSLTESVKSFRNLASSLKPKKQRKQRRQSVENYFAKVELNGVMKNKKSTNVAKPDHLLTTFDTDVLVDVKLERSKDRSNASRVDLANTVSSIFKESLSKHFGSERVSDRASSSRVSVHDDSISPEQRACLEVRVAVASEGSQLRKHLLGKTKAKLAVTWCLYTQAGKILKVGRSALRSMELEKDILASIHATPGKAEQRRLLWEHMSNQLVDSITREILCADGPISTDLHESQINHC